VTSAAFGNISGGLLNISTMKTGRLTLARLSNTGERYTMHICGGEGKLKSWEEAGWDYPAPQLPSLEIFTDTPVEEFAQNISGQHYIIAYGDHTQALRDFCYLKDIETV
jgi:L-fucose isomerase-like protein